MQRKKILRKIGLMLLIVIAVVVVVVDSRPDEFSVTRSATMAAPAAAIFEQVNDLQKWDAWSPWAKLDPNAKTTFEGPQAGEGAVTHWEGNHEVGAGSMTITESRPGELVHFRLDFLKPFKNTSEAKFIFKPEGDQTVVTWTMSGKANFLSKAMSLVFDCEKMVGEQFAKGLASMKAIVEGQSTLSPNVSPSSTQ